MRSFLLHEPQSHLWVPFPHFRAPPNYETPPQCMLHAKRTPQARLSTARYPQKHPRISSETSHQHPQGRASPQTFQTTQQQRAQFRCWKPATTAPSPWALARLHQRPHRGGSHVLRQPRQHPQTLPIPNHPPNPVFGPGRSSGLCRCLNPAPVPVLCPPPRIVARAPVQVALLQRYL